MSLEIKNHKVFKVETEVLVQECEKCGGAMLAASRGNDLNMIFHVCRDCGFGKDFCGHYPVKREFFISANSTKNVISEKLIGCEIGFHVLRALNQKYNVRQLRESIAVVGNSKQDAEQCFKIHSTFLCTRNDDDYIMIYPGCRFEYSLDGFRFIDKIVSENLEQTDRNQRMLEKIDAQIELFGGE